MLTEQEQDSVKDFYGKQIEQMAAERIRQFLSDKSIAYVALGSERGFLDIEAQEPPANIAELIYVNRVNGLPNSIKIRKPDPSTVPASVIESFAMFGIPGIA